MYVYTFFPSKTKNSTFSTCSTGSEARPDSYLIAVGDISSRIRCPEREADGELQWSTAVKETWRLTSATPHVFTVWSVDTFVYSFNSASALQIKW
jgi:hypothetical protein